jgi:5-methylcytosine-specific restriction endonuclease McrA
MRQHPLALTRKDLISMLFIDNKYTNWYNSIIDSARNRILEGYSENHHIIPKSLGGSNDKSNIVALTAREHFICHRSKDNLQDTVTKHPYRQ